MKFMKKLIKALFIVLAIVVAVIILIALVGIYKFNFTNNDIYVENGGQIASKDTTYLINGESISLKNGLSEIELSANSGAKITTRYFGNDAKGDLNEDGQEDLTFILTQDSEGSGTFYYLAVALANSDAYQGLNAVFLGDRIAPQTTEIKEGKIIVNYVDRKINEAMTTAPSVAISKYFKVIDRELTEINVDTQISNRDWVWVKTLMSNNEVIVPKNSDAFSINFHSDGTLSGTSDCNNFFASYEITNNGLSFGHFGSTEMYCEDSQEAEFLKNLAEVENYSIDSNNNLLLQLKFDAGVIIME